jgi:hypothetical protein
MKVAETDEHQLNGRSLRFAHDLEVEGEGDDGIGGRNQRIRDNRSSRGYLDPTRSNGPWA